MYPNFRYNTRNNLSSRMSNFHKGAPLSRFENNMVKFQGALARNDSLAVFGHNKKLGSVMFSHHDKHSNSIN